MERPKDGESSFEELSRTLAANAEFHWEKGGPTWAGLNQEEIFTLSVLIAQFIGITPRQAEDIKLIYGDHYRNRSPLDGHYMSCYCAPYPDLAFKTLFAHCDVVINRSLELIEYVTTQDRKTNYHAKKISAPKIFNPSISGETPVCCFRSSLEMIIWVIAEELKHSHIFLTAKFIKTFTQWEKNYLIYLQNKGFKTSQPYDLILSEVATSRTALRVLASFSQDEQRKNYFRRLYRLSLDTTRAVSPEFFPASFVSTGFVPPQSFGRHLATLARKITPKGLK